MVGFKELTEKNQNVDCDGQRALVTGGTQGIGAGIALRYALAGASVWIVGRNEQKANSVLEQLRLASAEAHRRKQPAGAVAVDSKQDRGTAEHDFFQADLSKVEDIERVAGEIQKKAGSDGIDWLIETQGGPPTGVLKTPASPRSPEAAFAVQCVSRFGIAHLLTQAKVVRKGICWVAAPGTGGSKPLDVNDLDFQQAKKRGDFKEGWFGIPKIGMKDSSVMDACTQVLAERNPNLVVSHLFPGIVATDAAANQGFSWPFVQASKLAKMVGISSSPSPGGYPEVPFFLHANPEGASYLRKGEANLFSPGLSRYSISSNVSDPKVREQVYKNMAAYFNK